MLFQMAFRESGKMKKRHRRASRPFWIEPYHANKQALCFFSCRNGLALIFWGDKDLLLTSISIAALYWTNSCFDARAVQDREISSCGKKKKGCNLNKVCEVPSKTTVFRRNSGQSYQESCCCWRKILAIILSEVSAGHWGKTRYVSGTWQIARASSSQKAMGMLLHLVVRGSRLSLLQSSTLMLN